MNEEKKVPALNDEYEANNNNKKSLQKPIEWSSLRREEKKERERAGRKAKTK